LITSVTRCSPGTTLIEPPLTFTVELTSALLSLEVVTSNDHAGWRMNATVRAATGVSMTRPSARCSHRARTRSRASHPRH
jgi:hypothetical protein